MNITEGVPYKESMLYRIRHSTAHVMAQAVMEMFPEARIAIGPPIEDGFYYDFDLPRALTPEDLDTLEIRMREIIAGNHDFKKTVVSAEKALEVFDRQPYKKELIQELAKGGVNEYGEPTNEKVEISIYQQDTFIDLCRGPHVENTSQINREAIKLTKVAGAYWRGDENRPMLQRIYGTAWETEEELKLYLWKLDEAQKRDHRRLGRELDLFSISSDVGPGLILWHPKGGMIRKIAEDYWRVEHEKAGYDFVFSPNIGKAELWKISGHLSYFAENMFSPMDIEEQQYYLKPMNCPFHIQIYKSQIRSYRDLPLRFAELGTVYRYERSGVLHGLLRVRGFTQDDAHHFCRPDQIDEEIDFVLDICVSMLRAFGFDDIQAYLSTRPEKSVGSDTDWHKAELALENSLRRMNVPYKIEEGGGAFYGPKIDLKVKDALGREWQLSTNQFDFNLPERFDLYYIGEDGEQHRPYMVHRTLLGSMERFLGVLIEHYAGSFPVWLSPVQAELIPITDDHVPYAKQVAAKLQEKGMRVEVNTGKDRMANKIRKAQEQKVPYMLIVGDREMENGTLSVRLRGGENLGSMSVESFAERANEATNKKIGP